MKPKLIYNFKFLLPQISAITLYPFIFFREKQPSLPLIVHELTHFLQVKRIGWFKFYFDYLWQYIKNIFKYKDHWTAYLLISYETEARKNQEKFEEYEENLDIETLLNLIKGEMTPQ